MNFLFPAFLLGALAVAIPIVLHFLRRDSAPEVPFTAVRLLHKSPIERSHRRRLRDLLLLAARVAALLLLAFAFARPYLTGAAGAPAPLRIVAIDRSYSMAAPGAFERARALAERALDEARAGQRVALLGFDDRADLLSPPGPAADARAALRAAHPTAGGTRYGTLLARAAEVADGQPAHLVVITDLQRAGWEDDRRAAVPASLEIEVRDAGAAGPNVAVTSVHAQGDRVVATLRSFGAARSGQVRVNRDGRDVASAPYRLDADAAVDVPIAFRPPASGSIAVSAGDPGGLPADDTRYLSLDRGTRPSLLLVTSSGGAESAFFLSRALDSASPSGGSFDTRAVSGGALSAMPSEELSRYAAVVVLSTRGLDRRGREALGAAVARGAGLLVAAAPDVEPAAVSGMFTSQLTLSAVERGDDGVTLAATDLRHPIFRPFGALAANLGQVRFTRAWRIRPDGWDVAARFTDGSPALVERRVGEGRVVLFASDIDRRWNDFPLHPAFVPFAVEAVRYVSGVREGDADYLVSAVPTGTPAVPGIHTVGRRTVAVNVDTREANTARLTAAEFTGMIDRVVAPAARQDLRAQQAEAAQGYWRYGLLLMIVALVAESIVGRVS